MLLQPWDFPGKSTGVGCHLLLQGIFLTQGLNPGLPHCRQTLYRLSHQGRTRVSCIVGRRFTVWATRELPAYLRLLIFLPAILIPVCASSSPAFLMMYSAYKLNRQGDNIQPWRTPFPIWNQSVVPCPVVTVASWPAYRFLKRQVRWSGIPISQNFPQLLWSTQSKALA